MPAPSIVQQASNSGTTSPITVTLPGNTAAGNCLVVCIGEGNSTTNPTVSGITLGGAAGNFALVPGASVANNADANVEIWTDQNCAGGQTSVAVSFNAGTGAGNGYDVWVFEVNNVLTSGAVDKVNAAGAGSGAWSSGSTGTLSQANEIAIGVGAGIGSIGAPTLTGPASPWNNVAQVSAARTAMLAGWQVVSATTALTYSGTTTTGRVGAAIITLLGTAAVAGTVQPATATPAPRRPRRRAVVTFTPVSTVNGIATGPAGTIQPRPTLTPPRRPRRRAVVTFTPVKTANARRQLIIALASQAGTDDYGNTFPQGILATEGTIEGPVIIGSDAFFYSAPALGGLVTSITAADGTDAYGNAFIAGTASYHDSGLGFVAAVVVDAGVVTWYKAATFAGPWTAQAGIGFTFNGITGGGLSITAPAGISGSFAIPQPSPAATSAAIISALFAAGIFN